MIIARKIFSGILFFLEGEGDGARASPSVPPPVFYADEQPRMDVGSIVDKRQFNERTAYETNTAGSVQGGICYYRRSILRTTVKVADTCRRGCVLSRDR